MQKRVILGSDAVAWPATSIIFVWFTSDGAAVQAEKVFAHLTGSEPDTLQRSRVPTPFLQLAHTTVNDCEFQVSTQANRVDFTISAPRGANEPDIVLLNDWQKRVREKLPAVMSLDIPSVQRCAVVANLFKRERDLKTVSRAIFEKINTQLDIPDAIDLIFQLNVRKKLDDGREFNRIMKFEQAQMQMFNIIAQNGLPNMARTVLTVHGASLLVDVNTVISPQMLTSSEIPGIWSGLVTEIIKLTEDGSFKGLLL